MLVGVYQDPRRSSDTSKSAEGGNYGAFVVIHYYQLHLIQPKNPTNKQDGVTIITNFLSDSELPLAALQRNTPQIVLLGIKQMLALCYYLHP